MTDDSQNNNEINADDLNLDDVVGMDPNDLTDTHRDFLSENKEYLTEDQQTKFGFGESGDDSEDDDEDAGGEDSEDDDDSGDDDSDDDEKNDGDDDDAEINPDDVEIKSKNRVGDDSGDDDDDDDMDPEDKARIKKMVNKGTQGVLQRQQELEDKQSVDALIAQTPELKKYRAVALKYAKSPAYANVPIKNIMGMLSAKDQQKIGARKEREAAEKANKTKNPGNSRRSQGSGVKDWGKATDEEVEVQIARAKGQRI